MGNASYTVNIDVSISIPIIGDAIVMNGMVLKCHRCKKASVMKNFTEGMVVAHADNNNRFYL